MKSLTNYINETENTVKHKELKDRGEFYVDENNKLTYCFGTEFYPVNTPNAIELAEIFITDRNKHIGTSLINAFIDFAKKINRKIVLYAAPLSDNMNEDELIKFYKKFGFEQDSRINDKHCLIYKNKE